MKKSIAVISAQIKKKNSKWVSTDLNDFDKGGPGGNLRLVAAKCLYQKNPDAKIITSGGRGHDVENDEVGRPDLSSILKRELVEMGVPEKSIIEENKSNTTFEQLDELQKIAKEKNINHFTIISNIYHLPRIQAMIENIFELIELKTLLKSDALNLEAAEDIIMENNQQDWQDKIEFAYKSERMQEIIKNERKGIKQLKEGTYKYK
jgi:hypothetical protein